MNEIKEYNEVVFEKIKHIDEYGNEYWFARELQGVLEYKKWQKFINVIENAKLACEQSKFMIEDHFTQVGKMVDIGSKTSRSIVDYKLSRYACYLIVQNSDPRKEIVALGQTYFAIQTRRQEITEKDYSLLSEDEKRLYQRNLTKKGNYSLNLAAQSDELIANLFRISQTEQKLKRDNIEGEKEACNTHNKIGKIVRKAIKEAGGIMPEDLPTPKKSLKELEKDKLVIK